MLQNTELQAEVNRIRTEVQRAGGVTVEGTQLRLLCPADLNAPQHFARIAAIAQHEGWSFAFLPDGSVHFGAYSAADEPRRKRSAIQSPA